MRKALTTMEARLADGRTYLMGESLTECDVRAFPSLVRPHPRGNKTLRVSARPRLTPHRPPVAVRSGVRHFLPRARGGYSEG